MIQLLKLALFLTIMGTMITMSSSSWMAAWLGLEMNLLGFIPLMKNMSPLSNEAMMKYFLIQAITSSVFLMSTTLTLNFPPTSFFSPYFMMIALMMKIASSPLHFWMFPLIESLNWNTLFILLTWQKIAPLSLISSTYSPLLMTIFIISNALSGPMMMFNQTSLKKLMGYSSISHLGWILTSSMMASSLLTFYFIIYSLSTLSCLLLFKKFKLNFLSQLATTSKTTKLILFLNMMSMSGFPPLLGFLPKLSVILFSLQNSSSLTLMILLTMSSLMAMYSYARTSYSTLLLTPSPTSPTNLKSHKNILIYILPLTSLPLLNFLFT